MREKFPSGDDPRRKPGESGAEEPKESGEIRENVLEEVSFHEVVSAFQHGDREAARELLLAWDKGLEERRGDPATQQKESVIIGLERARIYEAAGDLVGALEECMHTKDVAIEEERCWGKKLDALRQSERGVEEEKMLGVLEERVAMWSALRERCREEEERYARLVEVGGVDGHIAAAISEAEFLWLASPVSEGDSVSISIEPALSVLRDALDTAREAGRDDLAEKVLGAVGDCLRYEWKRVSARAALGKTDGISEVLGRLADIAEKVGEGEMALGFRSDIELVTKSSGSCTLTAGLGWHSS